LRLWDVEQGKEVRRFEGQSGSFNPAVFSPDGRYVLSGGPDKSLRLWEVETGKEVRLFSGHARWVRHLAFSHDGRRALSGGSDGTVRLWDVSTARELQVFGGDPTGGIPRVFDIGMQPEPFFLLTADLVAFSPDDRQALSFWRDGTVRLWRLPPG